MDEVPTCGKGLAEHSALPARLAVLLDSLAAVLETHIGALDLSDANAVREREAYVGLGKEHRKIATDLAATAKRMADYRDLPVTRHDPAAMAGPKPIQVFEAFVQAEDELLGLLQQWVTRDRAMLARMKDG